MKKVLALILGLGLLGACGGKQGGGANNVGDGGDTASTEAVNYDKVQNTLEGTISRAEPFSDGVAVIEEAGNGRWLIDNTGKKLWSHQEKLPDNTSLQGYFVSGLCVARDLSTYNQRVVMAVDKKGEIVISTDKQGFTGICFQYNDMMRHSSLQDGYLVAYKIVENHTGVVLQIGVLDTKGNWLIPLSEDNPISRAVKDSGRIEYEPSYLYLGEGFVLITDTRMGVNGFILNIKTNKWFDAEFNINDYCGVFMENGVMMSAGGNQKVTANGEVSAPPVHMEGIYASGLFLGGYAETFGYYDANGSRAIDMSQYESITDHGFQGDKALIEIRNSNGNAFFTLIDRQGNFAFEPIALGGAALSPNSVAYSEGILIHRSYEEFIFYNEIGQRLFTVPNASNAVGQAAMRNMSEFSDGLAIVQHWSSSVNYVCSYYIDKTGNRVIG